MRKTINIIISVLILFFILSINSCGKEECNISDSMYEFVLPFELSPADSVFHIGDTITITSSVSNPVFERKTNKYYTLNDFKFYLTTSIYYLDTNEANLQFDFFKLIIDNKYIHNIYTFSNNTNQLLTQYNYSNDNYEIEFKIVPRKTGNFLLTQLSDINYRGGKQHFNGKCNNINNGAVVYMNNRQDNNINIITETENNHFTGYIRNKETNYKDFGGYCFKVIE